eukprot:CAMPEP_0195084190 /NCGR_PEP_ID=MMETSP0448-20130528/24923_1 /TAXON_ID=66468 /ORGANISM="Heterocapsa triquestra, Strain CCMP 448" /LENGTH=98 /DNA_ID=CAMNT_0040117475 /DNA_START=571 /DNA_END=864 /DNA_ORIENTATION=+
MYTEAELFTATPLVVALISAGPTLLTGGRPVFMSQTKPAQLRLPIICGTHMNTSPVALGKRNLWPAPLHLLPWRLRAGVPWAATPCGIGTVSGRGPWG